MKRFPSADDADGLLGAHRLPSDLPDEATPLATLFSRLRNHEVAARDAEADDRAIAAMVAGIRSRSLQVASGTPHSIVRRVPVKAAALAFAAVLVSGTAAAAVNGSLPGPVQRAVASTLSHVNISVPNPDDHSNTSRGNGAKNHAPGQTDPRRGSAAPSGPVGPDAGGAARYGLCTAAGENASTADDAVAFSNLQKAASDAGMTIAEFCAGVTKPTGSTGPGATHPTGPTGPSGPTGGPTGPTGPVDGSTTTTTTVLGPPTSHPGPGSHTPTTEPKGPTGPPTSHGGGINSGSAHLPAQGDAGS